MEKIDVTTRPPSSRIPLSTVQTDIPIDGDARWTPVRKSKNKRKEKRNQMKEVEVPPQASIPPISMPKELPKRQQRKK